MARRLRPVQGDLQAVQQGVLAVQGQREVRASQQGALRWHMFHIPMYGDWEVNYTPLDVAVTSRMVKCKFAVAFMEPPMMDVSVHVADGESWTEDDRQPEATACVVNWRRIKKSWAFVGADVSLTCREIPSHIWVVATLAFWGPAIATPLSGVGQETESTNPEYENGDPGDPPPPPPP